MLKSIIKKILPDNFISKWYPLYRKHKCLYYYYRPYNFEKHRLNNITQCKEPLLAISSVMRSGGNLLKRLFDGHSQLRTYHSELLFSVASSSDPAYQFNKFPIHRNSEDLEYIFKFLTKNDWYLQLASFDGFVKTNYDNPLPFIYKRRLHKKIFIDLCKNHKPSQREILNNYITGFFNAYIDYQSLYGIDKKYTTTYWPGFVLCKENIDRFFSVYNDGKIVHIFRNPFSWAGSAKKRAPQLFNKEYMDNLWLKSTENAIFFKEKYLQNFICIDFDNLLSKTEEVMMTLCSNLKLQYENSMAYPTFNGMAIEANSVNIENRGYGIVKNVLKSYEKILTKDDLTFIGENYSEIYRHAKSLAVKVM